MTSYDIYINQKEQFNKTPNIVFKANDTVEICIQGGIIAVKGISDIFMVTSVQVVPIVPKTKKEKERDPYSGIKVKKEKSFDNVLSEAVDKLDNTPSEPIRTSTYGPDSMMNLFLYQSREYTYK